MANPSVDFKDLKLPVELLGRNLVIDDARGFTGAIDAHLEEEKKGKGLADKEESSYNSNDMVNNIAAEMNSYGRDGTLPEKA